MERCGRHTVCPHTFVHEIRIISLYHLLFIISYISSLLSILSYHPSSQHFDVTWPIKRKGPLFDYIHTFVYNDSFYQYHNHLSSHHCYPPIITGF